MTEFLLRPINRDPNVWWNNQCGTSPQWFIKTDQNFMPFRYVKAPGEHIVWPQVPDLPQAPTTKTKGEPKVTEKPPIVEQLKIVANCVENGHSYPDWFGNPNQLNRTPWVNLLRDAATLLKSHESVYTELEQMKKLNGKLFNTLYGKD